MAVTALAVSTAHAQGELIGLASQGVVDSTGTGISADGSVIVGSFTSADGIQAYRWTRGSGMDGLGTAGMQRSHALGVSADGAVVVGYAYNPAADPEGWGINRTVAFRWTRTGGMQLIGSIGGSANAVSADGSVVVGRTGFPGTAFRWTESTGMVSLGTLNGGTTEATGVSADGSVVVGGGLDGNVGHQRAFRWTAASGRLTSLGTLTGAQYSGSHAFGVSPDGEVVVGLVEEPGRCPTGNCGQAFRWTESTGMVGLGTLPGGVFGAAAYAASRDGSVIVGTSSADGSPYIRRAFRWTQVGGIVPIADWLRASGVTVAQGLELRTARAVNADGSVVVGEMGPQADPFAPGEAYVARVGSSGSGLISIENYYESLVAAAPQRAGTDRANLVLHGAHGNPLLGLIQMGQSCLWATGDWGRTDDDDGGSLAAGEFGGCRRFASGLQLNAALGGAQARRHLPADGDLRHNGAYALIEALVPLPETGLWATVTAYYGWGDVEIYRRYLNAGAPDASLGQASSPTWAIRGRMDWQDAFTLIETNFAPYADLSHIRTKFEAYTETGGAFPAHFDDRGESTTHLRLGVNAVRPISLQVRLLGTLEGVHQFNDEGAGTTGQVLGLFAFDLPGPRYKQNWLRVSLGADTRVIGGTASLMASATTEGQDPSYWVSATYRLAF